MRRYSLYERSRLATRVLSDRWVSPSLAKLMVNLLLPMFLTLVGHIELALFVLFIVVASICAPNLARDFAKLTENPTPTGRQQTLAVIVAFSLSVVLIAAQALLSYRYSKKRRWMEKEYLRYLVQLPPADDFEVSDAKAPTNPTDQTRDTKDLYRSPTAVPNMNCDPNDPDASTSNPFSPDAFRRVVDSEYSTFVRQAHYLMKQYRGKYIAMRRGDVVATASSLEELAGVLQTQYPNEGFFVEKVDVQRFDAARELLEEHAKSGQ